MGELCSKNQPFSPGQFQFISHKEQNVTQLASFDSLIYIKYKFDTPMNTHTLINDFEMLDILERYPSRGDREVAKATPCHHVHHF